MTSPLIVSVTDSCRHRFPTCPRHLKVCGQVCRGSLPSLVSRGRSSTAKETLREPALCLVWPIFMIMFPSHSTLCKLCVWNSVNKYSTEFSDWVFSVLAPYSRGRILIFSLDTDCPDWGFPCFMSVPVWRSGTSAVEKALLKELRYKKTSKLVTPKKKVLAFRLCVRLYTSLKHLLAETRVFCGGHGYNRSRRIPWKWSR